jgi:PAS domain S-box-containing protein
LGVEIPQAWGSAQFDSVLAVPLVSPAETRGWLLLADKLGAEEFSSEDSGIASTLASQAALAYESLEERRRTEEEVRESKAMFESLFESAPDALLASDEQGRIVQVNAQAESLFGYERKELVGQPIEILVPERFRRTHSVGRSCYYANPHRRVMGTGLDLRGRRKDGGEVPVDIMLSPIEDGVGSVVLSVVRDITQRKEAEERVKELNRQLQARVEELVSANESLEAFSYSVSHDLRAPQRHIAGFCRILVDEYGTSLNAEGQRLLGIIAASALKMGQLIEDLLAFSRVSRAGVHKSNVDMTTLAQSVVDELRASDGSRQVSVRVHSLPPAQGDPALLRQVYTNLISNAWKFTQGRTDAAVEVGSFGKDKQSVYFVKDNGAGFDMEYASKLFGVFQRLHSDREFEGTGIGLALVRRIVQRHGGQVWAKGQTGEGATFYFTLEPGNERASSETAQPILSSSSLQTQQGSPG